MPTLDKDINDLKVLISENEIQEKLITLAKDIENVFPKDEVIYVICVLKGSTMFTVDLVKHFNNPIQMEFIRISSYGHEQKSSNNLQAIDLTLPNLHEKNVLIVEDIIDSAKDKDGFIVILNEILDPHNLGSIIRVCECAGVDGLIISRDRSASVNDTVMRISAGALNHVKVARVTNINNAIDTLKDNGYWVYGAELGGDNIYKSNLTGKICIVIGGEDSGVKRLTKEKCDGIISIPMFGKVNSLNASVACGIAVYEAIRQRSGN